MKKKKQPSTFNPLNLSLGNYKEKDESSHKRYDKNQARFNNTEEESSLKELYQQSPDGYEKDIPGEGN